MSKNEFLSLCRLPLLLMMLWFIPSVLKGQMDKIRYPEQFLLPEFTEGKIKMKTGKDWETHLNYNLVSQKVTFIRQGEILDLTNISNVDTVYINGRKFIPSGNVFYEVLSADPFILYVQHKANVKAAAQSDSYGKIPETASSTSLKYFSTSAEFYKLSDQDLVITREDIYWLMINDSLQSFRDTGQLIKLFPGLKDDIRSYVRKNKLKFSNPEDIKRLAGFCIDGAK
jgi:hypothetical protein